MKRTLSAALLVAATALPAWADMPELRLIVDRGPKAIEIFANFEAADMGSLLQTDPQGLAAPDGRVYFGGLRETGTFDFGDMMISGVELTVDGTPTLLEAMSIMVHPGDNDLDFATPIDGAIAMAVCGVPDPEVPPTMDELALYSGFIAYPEDGYAPLALALPNDTPVALHVITYAGGQFKGEDRITIPAQGILTLSASAPEAETWLSTLVRWARGT